MTLRLLSYNVHKCLGLDRRRRPDRIVSVMAGMQADVLVLQEVDHRLGRRPAALPRELAEQRTGLQVLPFALAAPSLGWYGQTMLVRPDFTPLALRRIILPGLEPRGAIVADLDTPEGAVRIVGVHLGLIRRFRRMQLAAISAWLSHHAPLPTVIMGDFNEWSSQGGDILWPGFHVHAPGASFPAARPVGRLDRIAVGPGLHLKDAGVTDGALARVASDHLPVWAEIGLS